MRPVNRGRQGKRFAANYGSEERVRWVKDQPCACAGHHPECKGPTQNAHTVSKNHRGTDADVIPMSAGCHRWQGDHGFAAWERAAGLVSGEAKRLAARLSLEGPGAPGLAYIESRCGGAAGSGPPVDAVALAAAIQDHRSRTGSTSAEFAVRVGVTRTTIHRLLHEGRSPRADTVRALVEVLGVAPHRLLETGTTISELRAKLRAMEAS